MEYYNNEFKQAFLNDEEYITSNTLYNACKTVFNKSRSIEEELGKDLYQFTTQELANLFGEVGWVTANAVNGYKSYIKKYYMYAEKHNKILPSDVVEVSRLRYEMINTLDAIKDIYYKSYDEFIGKFNFLFSDTGIYKNYYITLRMKCLLGLVWFGVHRKDILSLTMSDINLKDKTVHSKSLRRYIQLPDEIINLCVELANVTYYTEATGKIITLPEDDTIIKVRDVSNNIDDEGLVFRHLITNFKRDYLSQVKKFSHNKKELDKFIWSIKLERIKQNGCFERAYQYEKEKGVFESHNDYAKVTSLESRIGNTFSYLTYLNWKEVFYS